MNGFKQGPPDDTRSLFENNIRGLCAWTLQDLDGVKKYSLTSGTAARALQAPLASISTPSTPCQRIQAVNHVPDNLSMDSFQTSPHTMLYATVPSTPHGVDPTQIPRLQVTDDHMEVILIQMENRILFVYRYFPHHVEAI